MCHLEYWPPHRHHPQSWLSSFTGMTWQQLDCVFLQIGGGKILLQGLGALSNLGGCERQWTSWMRWNIFISITPHPPCLNPTWGNRSRLQTRGAPCGIWIAIPPWWGLGASCRGTLLSTLCPDVGGQHGNGVLLPATRTEIYVARIEARCLASNLDGFRPAPNIEYSDFLASFHIRASKIESRGHLTSILHGNPISSSFDFRCSDIE